MLIGSAVKIVSDEPPASSHFSGSARCSGWTAGQFRRTATNAPVLRVLCLCAGSIAGKATASEGRRAGLLKSSII